MNTPPRPTTTLVPLVEESRCAEEPAPGPVGADEEAFAAVYRCPGSLAHTVATRPLGASHEAEDVTRQVSIGVWRGRHGFRPEREVLDQMLPVEAVSRSTHAQRELPCTALHEDLTQVRIPERAAVPLGRSRASTAADCVGCARAPTGATPSAPTCGLVEEVAPRRIHDTAHP
ncbi:sigma factor [Streptomyces rochei]|uniref:sigma factor n=1 Tax=Streptomyces rochei TaxID=1928 RepID=UPI0036A1779E